MAIIIISYDLTTREADRLAVICYIKQQDFTELAVLAGNLRTKFTAADFFEINRTTLFSLLSVVTTYFIIILEFRQ